MEKIEPKKHYTLTQAFKFSPFQGFQTFRRYVDKGILKVTQVNATEYSVLGRDLIEFLAKYEDKSFK